MNILILGAGEVGYHIAERLAREGNNVSVVDNNEERLKRVANNMDVRTVLGEASHPSVLARAGAADAELLIAATVSDESNMLACQVAHSLFKVTTKMARIREPDFIQYSSKLFGRDDLPIDTIISPEREAANSILRRLQVSSALDAQDFSSGRVQLLSIKISPKSRLAGISIADISERLGDTAACVVAHEHNGSWCVPDGSTSLLAGDSVYLAVARIKVEDLFHHLEGSATTEYQGQRNVMIIGGGHIAYIVARQLEKRGIHTKIIEHNTKRADWMARNLERSVVICGDALDRVLLEEENIDDMNDYIALTNDDETNILGSLIAKKYKVPHIITLVNRTIYSRLVREIGLDIVVSPRLTTAASILRHVRKGKIYGMSSLGDGSLEVLEAEALKTSGIVNTPLCQLKFPKQSIVAAVIRGEQVIIPNGNSVIIPGDHVLMVARTESVPQVESMFEVSLEFF
ncbi:MAG: Trk system potassium transporter TrkA [Mariprofundaceae bacterium]|nr:Trk system potassium transporter TrkA [Mariprofundaceae bacterium]